jgi:WD40 repeat protein
VQFFLYTRRLFCRRYVATGQTASKATKGKGTVCVWDANDCRQLTRMDGCHQRGVNSVAFSPDGTRLLSVGMDDKNTHILWKDAGGGWSKATQLATEGGDQNQVSSSPKCSC